MAPGASFRTHLFCGRALRSLPCHMRMLVQTDTRHAYAARRRPPEQGESRPMPCVSLGRVYTHTQPNMQRTGLCLPFAGGRRLWLYATCMHSHGAFRLKRALVCGGGVGRTFSAGPSIFHTDHLQTRIRSREASLVLPPLSHRLIDFIKVCMRVLICFGGSIGRVRARACVVKTEDVRVYNGGRREGVGSW